MGLKSKIIKYYNNQNWNIGFVGTTPKELVENQKLGSVEWLKHPYKDRFFADPFIYSVSEKEIVVFVEELEFDKPIGRLSELIVDAKSKKLVRKYTLLELDTHLSYPAIIRRGDDVFVCPENGASGKLSLYKYNGVTHALEFVSVIMNESLADATIRQIGDKFYMFATKVSNTQGDLYLYQSTCFDGEYQEVGLVAKGRGNARPAGDIFEVEGVLYRPAQNCSKCYGGATEIMQITKCEDGCFEEKHLFSLPPTSFRYNLGLHTLNFHGNIGVIDGYGYLYPLIGRLLHFVRKIIKGKI